MQGGCTCRHVRYQLTGKPMVVHACHCRWCQRETGTVHALNAVYEADRVSHTAGHPEIIVTPSASGRGQQIARCPICKVAVWSNYAVSGPAARFSTIQSCVLQTSTYIPLRSSRGYCSPLARERLPSSTNCQRCGRPKAWSAVASCGRRQVSNHEEFHRRHDT